jgi:hypothetical protein
MLKRKEDGLTRDNQLRLHYEFRLSKARSPTRLIFISQGKNNNGRTFCDIYWRIQRCKPEITSFRLKAGTVFQADLHVASLQTAAFGAQYTTAGLGTIASY